jgi:hypothetical protein
MAMIARSPLGSSWQKTTCSWPERRSKSGAAVGEGWRESENVATVVTSFLLGPGDGGLVWIGSAGVVQTSCAAVVLQHEAHPRHVGAVTEGGSRFHGGDFGPLLGAYGPEFPFEPYPPIVPDFPPVLVLGHAGGRVGSFIDVLGEINM